MPKNIALLRQTQLYKSLPSNCKHLLHNAVTSCRNRETNSQKPGLPLTTRIESAPAKAFQRRCIVTYLRRTLSDSYPSKLFQTDQKTFARAVLLSVISLAAIRLLAQRPQSERPSPPAQQTVVTVPAGTRIPLVLTHPVQSRVIHRGDDIYAQVTAPVRSGDQMVIPPGTFVQGTVDKLDA